MGPYPLSDSTNLLGPTSTTHSYGAASTGGGMGVGVGVGLGGGGLGGGGSSTCYTNYGTNIQTPVAARKCYHNESDYVGDDSFRRHSAHGRMSCRLQKAHKS
ncbi:blast:Glucose transporter type 1 [Drosophila guanche]|uniref:Blast:Glucose transporter type 1 n=1 Tax=Drosophila guanche TaxID=7266 RepID=A0A3B0JV48_DROGU|nr:blast:Glucose transporter type 1 [Drosophila guanche]